MPLPDNSWANELEKHVCSNDEIRINGFLDRSIPIIINAVKEGYQLKEKDSKSLKSAPKILFVLRKAFKSTPNIPFALLNEIYNKQLLPDVGTVVQSFYAAITINEQFSSPEAALWKPVCKKACNLIEYNATNKNAYLAHIINMQAEDKHNLTMMLLKEGI